MDSWEDATSGDGLGADGAQVRLRRGHQRKTLPNPRL